MRRKLTSASVERGSVRVQGQQLRLRIIDARHLSGREGLYRYEVRDRSSVYDAKVDLEGQQSLELIRFKTKCVQRGATCLEFGEDCSDVLRDELTPPVVVLEVPLRFDVRRNRDDQRRNLVPPSSCAARRRMFPAMTTFSRPGYMLTSSGRASRRSRSSSTLRLRFLKRLGEIDRGLRSNGRSSLTRMRVCLGGSVVP